jgi:hypothetical protein
MDVHPAGVSALSLVTYFSEFSFVTVGYALSRYQPSLVTSNWYRMQFLNRVPEIPNLSSVSGQSRMFSGEAGLMADPVEGEAGSGLVASHREELCFGTGGTSSSDGS